MTDLREQEMQSRIDALSNTNQNLQTENQMLKAQVAQLQKMIYGSRTEQTKRILPETADGQLNLFNEAEVQAKKNAPEPCIEVPAHQRRKKQKDRTAELLAKFPHEERIITLPEEDRVCKRCGTALTSMDKEKIRTEIEFIPAKVKVIDYYRESFQCLACRKEAHFSIEKPAMPQPVIAKSIASPSSVAHVMVQKYQQSMPLYRQEREWKEIGIPLSRATLANWVIRPAECAIRNFTIGRKNWLFSYSPKGAKASAAVYSIIETAKANGLNPFQYLRYIFEHLPNADIQRHPEHLDDVLPWNETIQQNCKFHRRTKPS